MPKIKTTCIGAYPKPEYVPIIDWFDKSEGDQDMTSTRATQSYEERLAEAGEEAEALFVCAAKEVIADQIGKLRPVRQLCGYLSEDIECEAVAVSHRTVLCDTDCSRCTWRVEVVQCLQT